MRSEPLAAQSAEEFLDRLRGQDFPCLGAKSALARGGLEVLSARDITSAWNDLQILDALVAVADQTRREPDRFHSLAVVFDGPGDLDEPAFEQALWNRAQSLSDKDAWLGYPPDPGVSPDVDDPHFALSFGGEGFFVVGLHPRASRPARRFANPVLVFNPHVQFERLKAEGLYETMRRKIIARDVALAGSENPMLARFGEVSEARQYSGRQVEADWRCPYQPRGRLRHDP